MKTVYDLMIGLPFEVIHGNTEIQISQVAYDSRKVTRGTLFVCVRGYVSDGHAFLRAAAGQGAAAIVI
ncbi:Mur ligase domain-containing protein, partial [Klebsiella pneumoniae]|uniref:Mur ligase domain-containing protein n=1 Tax=Klebsiella pneumoniae TaxID=573 RepID=UPI0021B0A30E